MEQKPGLVCGVYIVFQIFTEVPVAWMIKVYILLFKVCLLCIDVLFRFPELVVILNWSKQRYTVQQLSPGSSEPKNWRLFIRTFENLSVPAKER